MGEHKTSVQRETLMAWLGPRRSVTLGLIEKEKTPSGEQSPDSQLGHTIGVP